MSSNDGQMEEEKLIRRSPNWRNRRRDSNGTRDELDRLFRESQNRFFPLRLTTPNATAATTIVTRCELNEVCSDQKLQTSVTETSQANDKEDNDIKPIKDLNKKLTQDDQIQVIDSNSRPNCTTPKRTTNFCKAPAMRHLVERLFSSGCQNLKADKTKTFRSGALQKMLLLTVAMVALVANWNLVQLISCQQQFAGEFTTPIMGMESRAVNGNQMGGGGGLMRPQMHHSVMNGANSAANNVNSAVLDTLVSFLQNQINNQQQQTGVGNQRRSPQAPVLPLGAIGERRQLNQPQPVSSTPVNPFAAAANFQPTRRQQAPQGIQFPQHQQPSLTLNRITNQFQGQSSQQNRFTSGQQLPAISAVPSGGANVESLANNNNQQQQQSRFLIPQRNRPPQNSGGQFGAPPPRSPLMPPPTGAPASASQQQPPKPITGFAPSGPPPNSASNNAISVVQSPANAIGQPQPQQQQTQSQSPAMQMLTPFEMPLLFSTSSNRSTPTTTTAAATTITNASQSRQTSTLPPQPPLTTTTSTTTTTAGSTGPGEETKTSTPASQPQPQTSTTASSNSSTPNPTPESSTQDPNPQTTTSSASETNWNPVQLRANRTRQSSSSLAPSPDIVTVPPGYNPDQPASPQNYDISVSAHMGGGSGSGPSLGNGNGQPHELASSSVESTPPLSSQASILVASAPTETTTIIWSSETQTSSVMSSGAQPSTSVTQTAAPAIQPTRVPQASQQPVASTTTIANQNGSGTSPNRIRDITMQDEQSPSPTTPVDVVYGKAAGRSGADAKSRGPNEGRPFIETAQLDNKVRPFAAGSQPLLKSNHGASSSSSLPFKPSRPMNGNSPAGIGGGMSVNSGFSIVASSNQTMPTGDIQDYVANAPPPIVSQSAEPTISAQGGPDPATFDLVGAASSSSSSVNNAQNNQDSGPLAQAPPSPPPVPRLRRPTFKPRPAVPPIRIDSCIVGDDSSCDQSHNERCITEYGISSCHCKPGFARLGLQRGPCSPVSSLQFNLKIDKLNDDRKLAFNQSLENPNSEEYQYLEYETIQALAGAMNQTVLARQFMGARVNKFYERKNKVWANVSLNLELNNVTRNEPVVQKLVQQELNKLVQQKRSQPLGDSTVVLDSNSPEPFLSKLVDVNECASKDLNDCSKHATCINEFGGFSCQCLPGYEDKFLATSAAAAYNAASQDEDKLVFKARQGRVCMGCSPAYCSNRGECSIVDGKKQCKCRANFIGARCDIDSEVLAVAVGGSLVGLIILVVTFWCLFVFNRRWRREQRKMDAISATSGLTYNYVNSNNDSTNSLMAQLGRGTHQNPGGVSGRSAANHYTMSQRLSSAAGSRLYHQHHHAADQQAIIGSTSSGSSAASQPIACNPYVSAGTGYPYDEGLLIAPASTGSSEQTSPSANSYRGIMGTAGNAYTLSGHHHHHAHHQHHLLQQQQHQIAHHMHHHHHGGGKPLSQFHPSALVDSYAARTLNTQSINNYCPTQQAANGYDSRWRTLQQADNSTTKQSSLAGYYLVR